MPRKRHTPEEIVAKLRQVEVLTAQGRPVAEAIRSISVTGNWDVDTSMKAVNDRITGYGSMTIDPVTGRMMSTADDGVGGWGLGGLFSGGNFPGGFGWLQCGQL